MSRTLLLLLATIIAGIMAACSGDITVAPADDSTSEGANTITVESLANAVQSETRYVCRLIRRASSGRLTVQTRRFNLARHGLKEAPDGRRALYQFRVVTEDEAVTSMLQCQIPRTNAAVAKLNQILGVPDEITAQSCVEDGWCYLGEITNSGSDEEACDPYQELDFSCEDDTCLNSLGSGGLSTNGCTDSGGGGSGGGGSDGDGSSGSTLIFQTADISQDTIIPECDEPTPSNPTAAAAQTAYCNSNVIGGNAMTWTQEAISRIEQRGGECPTIASRALHLLSQGGLRIYDGSLTPGYFGFGTSKYNLAVYSDEMLQCRPGVNTCAGKTSSGHFTVSLDWVIAHEVEHTLGRGHVDSEGRHTPNSKVCGGV